MKFGQIHWSLVIVSHDTIELRGMARIKHQHCSETIRKTTIRARVCWRNFARERYIRVNIRRCVLFPGEKMNLYSSADPDAWNRSPLHLSSSPFICLCPPEVGGTAPRVDKCEPQNSSYRLRLACDETTVGSLCFRPCAFRELDGRTKGERGREREKKKYERQTDGNSGTRNTSR